MARYFQLAGNAVVKGILFQKDDYVVAVPTTDDKFLQGELYSINEDHDFSYVIGQLDDYEGIHTEEGETPAYRRDTATVFINDQAVTAWIYWYNGSVDGLAELATGDVLEYLHQNNKM
jgi:gamma-glutamylcyclotransferase (GGCT)/AIG2-like uncharacterized protein YtfP